MKKLTTSLSFFGLIISTAIWGSTFFIIKGAVNSINPVTLVAYRFAIATIIFAFIVYFRKENFFAHAKHGFILGIFLWIQYIFQTLGLKYTTASNSGFITGLFIVFVPIFGVLFFKKKPTVMQIIALTIALFGLWSLTGGLKAINIGDLLTLITSMSVGFYVLIVDKFVKEKKSVAVLNFQQFFTTAILSLLTMFIFRLPTSFGNSQTLLPIFYLAIFGNAVGQGLLLLCQRYLKTVTASLLLSTEPVFAAIFSWTLGNELFIPARAVGGLFIVISILVSELPIMQKQKK